MDKLYDVLNQYKSISNYVGDGLDCNTNIQFTNTYIYVEKDRFGRIVLTSENRESICTIDPDLPYILESLPFNRDMITVFDYYGNSFMFNAKKI